MTYKELPDKYDTKVGEKGITLSGGQKQRIDIARALIKDSPILILDDSFSSVDTHTEEKVLENIKRLRKGRTTIIIAHGISTILFTNHVLVLEDGRKMEYGIHLELL